MLRPRSLLRLLAFGSLAAGCGGRRVAVEDVHPREMLVEVLPPGARVALDGRPLGVGSRTVAAPGPGAHVLRVEADGYEAAERPLPEGSLAGARVAEALRPVGLATDRILDYDEAEGLALAAAHLARRDRPADAAAYAERAVALDRGVAIAHRALGDARDALGDARGAASAWAEYVRLAPDAPDAPAIERRIEAERDAILRAR